MLLSDFKRGFFDTAAVLQATDAATRKAFSKYGAYVRTRARSSIRRKAGPSPPGTPPHAHQDPGLKEIFFAFDTTTRSVVVGPMLFNGSRHRNPTVPEVLEEGGGIVARRTRRAAPERVHVRERPFMVPAERATRTKLSDLLRDKVR